MVEIAATIQPKATKSKCCSRQGCTDRPTHGRRGPQKTPEVCAQHVLKGMVDLRSAIRDTNSATTRMVSPARRKNSAATRTSEAHRDSSAASARGRMIKNRARAVSATVEAPSPGAEFKQNMNTKRGRTICWHFRRALRWKESMIPSPTHQVNFETLQ